MDRGGTLGVPKDLRGPEAVGVGCPIEALGLALGVDIVEDDNEVERDGLRLLDEEDAKDGLEAGVGGWRSASWAAVMLIKRPAREVGSILATAASADVFAFDTGRRGVVEGGRGSAESPAEDGGVPGAKKAGDIFAAGTKIPQSAGHVKYCTLLQENIRHRPYRPHK